MSTRFVNNAQITLGCDPEIFIEDPNGRIIGAQEVIPQKGLSTNTYNPTPNIIIDGVQAEINPAPSGCRALLGHNIARCIQLLDATVQQKGFRLSSRANIEMSKEEMDAIAKEYQVLGCAPSNNAYNNKLTVNQTEENRLRRAAGGHIHMQCSVDPALFVPILDFVVGNTCVLLDRDPLQAKRREQYGRAGEYRLPKHGLEYRTPSNFWLRSYPLMGLVTGLCRMAYTIAGPSATHNSDYYYDDGQNKQRREAHKWLKAAIVPQHIELAINRNDLTAAYKNWRVLKEFIKEFIPNEPDPAANGRIFPIWPAITDTFEFFFEQGIDHWWPNKDVVHYWKNFTDGHGRNWESWFMKTVWPSYLTAQKNHVYFQNTTTKTTLKATKKPQLARPR